MPELPEVETIKIGLEKRIVGLKITKIQILSPKSFIGNPKLVEGQKILKVWRRAKILGMDLDKITLLFHLKMSGQLVYVPYEKRITKNDKRFVGGHPTQDMVDSMPNSHTRVIFSFSDPLRQRREASNSHLYFNDQRKFGWVRLVTSTEVTSNKLFAKLGPEPLEKGFTWQILKTNLLKHKSQPVKVVIMDRSIVSGVGNIYASEACFNAKIDPRKKEKEINDEEYKSFHQGVLKALRDGIKYGGSTRAHFVDAQGHKGYFLDYAFVYGRDNHLCKVCKTIIKKVQLGGRGTYFCPVCQS